VIGSGSKINYDVRPAKSAERKMLCDLLHLLQSKTSFFTPNQYVGMGSKYFNDFMLFHNEFGFGEMVSIEGDIGSINRYEFNKPLKCIDIRPGFSSEVLPSIEWDTSRPSTVWLDYDGSIDRYMLEDVELLARNLKAGSVFFVSFNPLIPTEEMISADASIGCEGRGIAKGNIRVQWLKSKLGAYFLEGIDEKALSSLKKPLTFKSHFDRVINATLNQRNILEKTTYSYHQLLFMKYRDSAEMLTFGGMIVDDKMRAELKKANLSSLRDFIVEDIGKPPWSIKVPMLTYKEVQAILKTMPLSGAETDHLKEIGITDDEINNFAKLYRYYPHFVQALVTS
jgi:hypothetical protein